MGRIHNEKHALLRLREEDLIGFGEMASEGHTI
jgi:hypothetical protein